MKIAIFRALYLGDMLCIIPAVRAIRRAFPHAEIFLVGLPWQQDFAERFDRYFDHFIEFPGWPGLPEQPVDTQRIFQFLRHIRNYHFDIVFQMQGNGIVTNSLCMLWDAKKVCGLRRASEYAPDEATFPVSEDGEHEILRFLKLPACLGIRDEGTHLEFPFSNADLATFHDITKTSGIIPGQYVCIHPGARDPRRRWPVENFCQVADEIAVRHGYKVVLTGSGEEKDLLSHLQQQISESVVNIVESFGHLTAGELAVVIRHARLLVSNDTGVSHIAAAMSTPSVVLFSRWSDINRWRPLEHTTHIAVPYEKSKSVDCVLQHIAQQLSGQHNANQASAVSAHH